MDPRSGKFWLAALLLAAAFVWGIYFFASGGAAEAKKAVDDTASEVTGHHAVKVGEELKSDLRNLRTQRAKAFEEAGAE